MCSSPAFQAAAAASAMGGPSSTSGSGLACRNVAGGYGIWAVTSDQLRAGGQAEAPQLMQLVADIAPGARDLSKEPERAGLVTSRRLVSAGVLTVYRCVRR